MNRPQFEDEPIVPAPGLTVEEDAAEELLNQQEVVAMYGVTWDGLMALVKRHPDFSDCMAEVGRGDCRPLREMMKATAISMVKEDWKKHK